MKYHCWDVQASWLLPLPRLSLYWEELSSSQWPFIPRAQTVFLTTALSVIQTERDSKELGRDLNQPNTLLTFLLSDGILPLLSYQWHKLRGFVHFCDIPLNAGGAELLLCRALPHHRN